MKKKQKVLIMRCAEYNPAKIAGIIKEGMEELDVRPSGRILLKPNAVMAHPKFFPYASIRKEFLDGVLSATKARARDVKEIAVGERSGITVPTRFNFKKAGFREVIKKHKVKTYHFDEVKQVPVALNREENLRKNIFVPKPISQCDFLINLPKFKAHPWCRLTLSLKNFIGIQDDRHRLVDHNPFLEHKIADLQDVIQPKFIAIDAITAGQKMMLTPIPFDMGAIVIGTNSCAVDTVCCHMVNVAPEDLIHLKLASERGLGPMNLNEIIVSGDFPLDVVRKKNKNFELCMEHIDNYFGKDENLTCTVGKFPEKHSPDYCWGGCPGALQEAMHILKGFNPDAGKEMKKVRYVVGKVDGPLDLDKDEKVIFAGSCTSWEGKIDGKNVKIESNYRTTTEVDEKKTKSNDMILKTISTIWQLLKYRSSRHVHVQGCTLSVAENLTYITFLGRIGRSILNPKLLLDINIAYWQMRLKRLWNRFFG